MSLCIALNCGCIRFYECKEICRSRTTGLQGGPDQRLKDNNKESVAPLEMISELCDDNQQLTRSLRATHEVCDHHNDVATASLIEVWIDEGERRISFLAEIIHDI
jgi:bacterioferritin (cytochrome b1)